MYSIEINKDSLDRYKEIIARLDSVEEQIKKQKKVTFKIYERFFEIKKQLDEQHKSTDEFWTNFLNGVPDDSNVSNDTEISHFIESQNLVENMKKIKLEIDDAKQIENELLIIRETIKDELDLLINT